MQSSERDQIVNGKQLRHKDAAIAFHESCTDVTLREKIYSIAEINDLERAYALGAPTLGVAARALLHRWRSRLRDSETFARLAFLSWYKDNEPDWLTGLSDALPPIDELIADFGGEDALLPEMRFVIAYLWSVFPPIDADGQHPMRIVSWAEQAANEEPGSKLFSEWKFFIAENPDTQGARMYIEEEAHARFSGRGALGNYLLHMISTRLRGPGASHAE